MVDEDKALTQWTQGFGNMNDTLFGSDKPREPLRRAIKSDWDTHRMPRTRAHIDLDIPLTQEEFEKLAWGHIPKEMEDHWFMYFDGEAFCFYRSWTGFCIYRIYVKRNDSDEGYTLYRMTANRSKKQYGETDDARDAAMATILIHQAMDRSASALWEYYFSIKE